MAPERDTHSPEEQIAELEERIRLIEERLWCPDCELPRGAMLSDRDIQRLIELERIKITPVPLLELGQKSDLGTCKVDLHLGRQAKIINPIRATHIDIASNHPSEEYYDDIDIEKLGSIVIRPGQLIIATTLEWLTLPDDIVGRMEGKSSLARRGVSVQVAPVFDAGWDGRPVMELHNIGGIPVVLHYKNPVCAMSFIHLSSSTLKAYAKREDARYGVQTGARF